jgi:xanthosine utilization system XapX-like protein
MIFSKRNATIALLILLAVLSRLIPHPPNFAAVGAVGLFAGASLQNRWLSLLVPLTAMFLSDLALGLSWMSFVIYGAMSLYVIAGWWAGNRIEPKRLVVASLAGSIGFFLVTNFACWLSMYEISWSGLVSCYVAAIPFFQNTLVSDLAYGSVLFGALKTAELRLPSVRLPSVEWQREEPAGA